MDIQREKVLIANANQNFCSSTKEFLINHGFGVVIIAKDGVEALQLIEIELPHIAIIDVALPGMYGFEICDFVRRNKKLKDIKLILLASVYDKTRYKRMPTSIYGADDYIEIHHIPDQLIAKINNLMGKEANFERPPIKAPVIEEKISSAEVTVKTQIDKLDKAHEDAKRLARIIISDIILYNQEMVEMGIKNGNLHSLLKNEIKEGQVYYAKRVPLDVRKHTAYLRNTLEEVIDKMKRELGV